MKEKINLFHVVALTVDLPKYNLWCGQVGAVVEILANGEACEVEFLTVKDAPMNRWVCDLTRIWYYIMSQ